MFLSLPIEGRWFIHGEDRGASYGRLFLDPTDGLRLEVKEINTKSILKLITEASQQDSDRPVIIQGYSDDNMPVRLFGCALANGTTYKMGMSTYSFSVLRAIARVENGRWSEIQGFKFYFTLGFLGSSLFRVGTEGATFSNSAEQRWAHACNKVAGLDAYGWTAFPSKAYKYGLPMGF